MTDKEALEVLNREISLAQEFDYTEFRTLDDEDEIAVAFRLAVRALAEKVARDGE